MPRNLVDATTEVSVATVKSPRECQGDGRTGRRYDDVTT